MYIIFYQNLDIFILDTINYSIQLFEKQHYDRVANYIIIRNSKVNRPRIRAHNHCYYDTIQKQYKIKCERLNPTFVSDVDLLD